MTARRCRATRSAYCARAYKVILCRRKQFRVGLRLLDAAKLGYPAPRTYKSEGGRGAAPGTESVDASVVRGHTRVCVYIYMYIYCICTHTFRKKERCFLQAALSRKCLCLYSNRDSIKTVPNTTRNPKLFQYCSSFSSASPPLESLIISHIMATVRKLQAEIDKTFRKVDEQQEVFQQVFDRLHECDQSLKEKYEVLLLIHATTMRFFSPNWNAQLFCHDRAR